MSLRPRRFAPALLAAFAFVLVNAVPSSLDMFGTTPAFAKKGGNGGGNGGGSGGGKGGGGKSSNSASAGGNGKSSTAPGKTKLTGTTKLANANAKKQGTKMPKSIVRQYVLANGLKQGDVAKLLKSWNSLNRKWRAYLNNMENPNSLPGLQIDYIRGNMAATEALADFAALGGDPLNPPTETDLLAAQDALTAQAALDAQAVLDAQARIDAGTPAPGDEDLVLAYEGGAPAAQTVVDGYTGGDPQTVLDTFAAAYTNDPQTVIDQFNAWTSYQGAEAAAQDAFLAASVSYQGELYDEALFGELRKIVDKIVEMKGLDTLVADFDAAAVEPTEPVEPTAPLEPTPPEVILSQ